METSLTVPKLLNYPPGMNYRLLRREGMRHLERLGSAIWTDFNSHDPGVTMLEVLCYALTDLGYRTQLPEVDLFTPSGNRKAFFTAAELLPNAPVTALDFRKILIDIEGVKNAWLEADTRQNVLFQWEDLDRKVPLKLDAGPYPQLQLTSVELEFSWSTVPLSLKDPYDATKTITNTAAYFNTVYRLKKDKKSKLLKELMDGFSESFAKNIVDKLTDNGRKVWLLNYAHDAQKQLEISQWATKRGIDSDSATLISLLKNLPEWTKTGNVARANAALGELLKICKKNKAISYYLFVAPLWQELVCKNSLTLKPADAPLPYSLFFQKGIYKIYLELEEGFKVQANTIRQTALARLHQHRALCEDFEADIKIVDEAPVCLTVGMELTPEADAVQVYAELLYAIENFLSPRVHMYGLQEMLDTYAEFELTAATFENLAEAELPAEILKNLEPLRGKSWLGKQGWTKAVTTAVGAGVMEDYEGLFYRHTQKIYEAHPVFQGPLLQHGFIDDAELTAASWRRVVYKSDLFQVVSNVESVARVTALSIKKSGEDNQNPKTGEAAWCLSFDCDCQPTLDVDCSSFTFTKNGIPLDLTQSMEEVWDKWEQLRGQNAKIDRTGTLDLPIPQGIVRNDLAEYTSIQEEFPRTYHVGREGIASGETPARKAQAKQMKGFLLFFDQILANYLAHLAQVREVLAVEPANEKGNLYQTLYEVPNVQPLLTAFDLNGDWEAFKNDTENGYVKALQSLTNGSDITQKLRQNQLVDHLLARFGEQFTDHALNLFQIERPLDETAATTDTADWAADKRLFLSKLPQLGSLRGRGFNYRALPQDNYGHFWDSDNEAGFKSRVLAQLGIPDWQRRTISCSPQFFTDTKLETAGKTKRYRFGIKKEENTPGFWLLSTASYSQEDAANLAADEFYTQSADTAKYDVIGSGKQWFVGFWDWETPAERKKEKALLLSDSKTKTEANKLLNEIRQYIEQQCQRESFHVVEHGLLRPADEHYLVLKPAVCPSDFSLLDPYSFWISVLMPDWVELFKDENRYANFEQLVRMEVPAHVGIHFFKLTQNEMLQFEQAYFEWLKVKTDAAAQAFDLRNATNKLVEELNKKMQ